MSQAEPIAFWRMAGVTKRYGGVTALSEVDFACSRHSIHAVLGENGAGKSTLVKIMTGVVQPDAGTMTLEDRPVSFASPSEATAAGIVCVFQELSLLPDLSVADNICITNPPRRFGLIDPKAQRRRAEQLLAGIGCADIDPREQVRNLTLSRRQMVEIAKALARQPKLLILDEATSALTAADVEKVFDVLVRLRDEGLGILYITHRLHESDRLADMYSVFRNGRHAATFPKGTHDSDAIVQLMVGRSVKKLFPPKPARPARPEQVLAVRDLAWAPRLAGISLEVGRGEIVGLGGLDGQGQRELLLALFGVLRHVGGTVEIDGKAVSIGSPVEAKSARHRMALIPEDRKTEGLMLPMSIADNISLASLRSLTRAGTIDRAAETRRIEAMIAKLQIKIDALRDPVATLSGGNQQKVVLAKWLMTEPRVILLADPTRGIDIGTKQEIYRLLRELADAGAAILFYSTDYDELIGCCDRVLILYQGRVVRELVDDEITETNIVGAALNLAGGARAAAPT